MYGQHERRYSCYVSPSLPLNGEGFGYLSMLTSHYAKQKKTADHAYVLQCSNPRLTGVPALTTELQQQLSSAFRESVKQNTHLGTAT